MSIISGSLFRRQASVSTMAEPSLLLLQAGTPNSVPSGPHSGTVSLLQTTIPSSSRHEQRSLLFLEMEPQPPSYSKRRPYRKIYVTLAMSLMLGLVSGTLYGYGRYSKDLKMTLNLSHYQVQLLGVILDSGTYIGHPFVGYIYDQYGSRISCLFGALIVFCSFATIHFVVSNALPVTTKWWLWYLLCGSFFFVGFGSGLGYTSALGSTTKSFQSIPQYRSLGVGIVATGFGFCSTLVGLSYNTLGLNRFFMFWAVLVASVNIIAAAVLNTDLSNASLAPEGLHLDDTEYYSDEDDYDQIAHGQLVTMAQEEERLPSAHAQDGILIGSEGSNSNSSQQFVSVPLEDSLPLPLSPMRQAKWIALQSLDFWILFSILGCCTGCGLFVINNVSTMVQSLGGTDSLTGRLVIILSISNCAGRILVGFLADRPNANKLAIFSWASTAMAVSLFCSATTSSAYALKFLVMTITVVVMAYGAVWVLVVALVSDWFGALNFGKNYGIMAIAPALSGMFFNSISAAIYERHAVATSKDSTTTNGDVCEGTICYRGSFLLTGFSAVLSLLLLSCLSYRRNSQSGRQQGIATT